MTTKDALIELLDRVAALNGAPTLINTDELDLWPGEAVAAMKAQKLITKARPASSVVCPGCEEECLMPVHTIAASSGNPALFIVCDKRDDIGRVPVAVALIEQWHTSGDSIADLIADLLGQQRSSMGSSSGDLWEIGVFRGAKHSSHLALLVGNKFTLTLAGYSIALQEVLTIDGETFKIDRRKLSRLVDNPSAGAGDEESSKQRGKRLKKRVREVKDSGERAFLKFVAEEEGFTVSRLKQILNKVSSPPKNPFQI